jgi:hypothetical protein
MYVVTYGIKTLFFLPSRLIDRITPQKNINQTGGKDKEDKEGKKTHTINQR